MTNKRIRGVYFLANNKTYELAVTFLNSFRTFNKKLSLCLIPYDDECGRVAKLSDEYQFSIFENSELLERCDQISLSFHESVNGSYRKFAIWEGAFDEFIYIDIDTVVLADLEFAFKYLGEYAFVTSLSHLPDEVRWVWKEGIRESNLLSDEQIDFGSNTGFVMSRKENCSIDEVEDRLGESLKLKCFMELHCQEQPLLNYIMITSGLRYSSLRVIYELKGENLWIEKWAGDKGGVVKKGQIGFPDYKPVLFVHWAGEWQERNHTLLHFLMNKCLKALGLSYSNLRFWMPYKKLWAHYRFMARPVLKMPVRKRSVAAAQLNRL